MRISKIFDRLSGRNQPEREDDREGIDNIISYPQEPNIPEDMVIRTQRHFEANCIDAFFSILRLFGSIILTFFVVL